MYASRTPRRLGKEQRDTRHELKASANSTSCSRILMLLLVVDDDIHGIICLTHYVLNLLLFNAVSYPPNILQNCITLCEFCFSRIYGLTSHKLPRLLAIVCSPQLIRTTVSVYRLTGLE